MTEKTIKSIIIKEIEEHSGEKYLVIDVLREGYNIITQSIYDSEAAQKILDIIAEATNY